MSDYEFLGKYGPDEPKRSRRSKKRGKKKNFLGRMIDFLLWGAIFGLVILITVLGSLWYFLGSELETAIVELENYESAAGGTPRFYDRFGRLIFELPVAEQRKALTWNLIPENIKQATVAVEDDTFWENYGVDPAAIGAAVWANSQNDGRPVGASTITQQLVRHVVFDYEDRVATAYDRKVKEILLAFVLTTRKTKEEILALYLNEIYYGNRAYGISAAAQSYFGKPVESITLAEAAYLAAIPQAPTRWDPYTNHWGVIERQHFILDLMVGDGFIDEATAVAAKLEPLNVKPFEFKAADSNQLRNAPHFVLYVQKQIEEKYGAQALERGGWQVVTSLDLEMQLMAEQAARQRLAAWGPGHNATNAAVVILKPQTSEVLAMVGSLDYFNEAIDGQVNMALAPRQPGSTFKPITYVTAMQKGWGPADVLWDVPIELTSNDGSSMKPKNYDNRFVGPVLMRDALANSYNIPPLQLTRDVGISAVMQTGRQMGLQSLTQSPDYYGLSLTLGGGEVPLLEITHAYGTLAAGGRYSRLNSVLSIQDNLGRPIYDINKRRSPSNQIVDPSIAWLISDMLNDNRARTPQMGANSALQRSYPVAVKTGTTNDFRDNLTIGYTPGVVVGVWMGNSDSTPMVNTSGLSGPAPMWAAIMDEIQLNNRFTESLLHNGLVPEYSFGRPSNIVDQTVCLPRGTGSTSCTAERQEPMISNSPFRTVGRFGYPTDPAANPGAWTLNILPLPAEAAQEISQPALQDGTEPPTPSQCVVNGTRENSSQRLYLQPPPYYEDEVRARIWARNNGFAGLMAPPLSCPLSVLRN